MKRIALILALTASPLVAVAAPTTQMTCAQAQRTVATAGGVVLYTGEGAYDRYVADRRFCYPTQIVKSAFVPTRDAPACPVGSTCLEPDFEHGDGGGRFR